MSQPSSGPGSTPANYGPLEGYVKALGGYLEVVADFGDDRLVIG